MRQRQSPNLDGNWFILNNYGWGSILGIYAGTEWSADWPAKEWEDLSGWQSHAESLSPGDVPHQQTEAEPWSETHPIQWRVAYQGRDRQDVL